MAVPTTTQSTLTWTLEMAVPGTVVLSMAQPETLMLPETVPPEDGESIATLGAPVILFTVTVTGGFDNV